MEKLQSTKHSPISLAMDIPNNDIYFVVISLFFLLLLSCVYTHVNGKMYTIFSEPFDSKVQM